MVITTTAIGFILLAFGVAILGFQFLKLFSGKTKSESNKRISFLLGALFFASAIQNTIIGLGALFFPENFIGLYFAMLISHIFLIIFALLAVYSIYYIFFPQRDPNFAIMAILILGFFGFLGAIFSPVQGFPILQGDIDISMNLPFAFSTLSLLLIGLSSTFYIFFQLFQRNRDRKIRLFTVTVFISALLGILSVIIKLIPIYNQSLASWRGHFFDTAIEIVGGMLIILVLVMPFLNYSSEKGTKDLQD